MKKIFKLAAIAAVAAFGLVACNNNPQPAEEDTTATEAIEQIADEMEAAATDVIDTVVPAVKEEVKKAAKATAKKVEQKVEKKAEETVKTAEERAAEDLKNSNNQQRQTAPLKRTR